MTVPISTQFFDAFLGQQEGIHSAILPDIFSSGGSKNVYIDKFGRVKRIPGYTKVNSSAFTTDTGASATMVRGLIPYRGTGGGTFTRRLLIYLDDQANEVELHYSTDGGATKTFLEDFGSGSVGTIPDACQFGDNLYLTNGKIQPRKYNGTSLTTTGLTQSPTITAVESATNGNLKGNYKYKLVSFVAGVRQNGSAGSTLVTLTDKQMDLSWTADANTSVTGYEIYRTTGTGTTYYYLTTIDGRLTVAYTDNTSDNTLLEQRILEEHGDAPPVCYYCEPHKQRMWWLRTDTYPTRGYWSDPAEPESVYAENYLEFSDSETIGDLITGALGNYEGVLVVFTERAIWTVSGSGAIVGDFPDWVKSHTNATTGSVSGRSVVRVPAGSKFTDQYGQQQTTPVAALAYFTPAGDIRIFDGENDVIVSHPVRDTLRSYNYEQRRKVYALDDKENSQLVWFFPSANSGEPDQAVCWNYQYGVWYPWPNSPFGHACVIDSTTDSMAMLVGEALTSKGGYIYTFFSGNSFDGSNIAAQWMTKTLHGLNSEGQQAFSNQKRWRWLDLLFRIETNTNITVEWLEGVASDEGTALYSTTVNPAADELVTADGDVILTADSDQILVSASSAQGKALLKNATGDYVHDTGLRFRVKTNDTSGGWALEAMQLAYQVLPGMGRRVQ